MPFVAVRLQRGEPTRRKSSMAITEKKEEKRMARRCREKQTEKKLISNQQRKSNKDKGELTSRHHKNRRGKRQKKTEIFHGKEQEDEKEKINKTIHKHPKDTPNRWFRCCNLHDLSCFTITTRSSSSQHSSTSVHTADRHTSIQATVTHKEREADLHLVSVS